MSQDNFKELGPPADEIHLVGGALKRVVPLSIFPGMPQKRTGALEVELLDKPGDILKIQAGDIKTVIFFETIVLDKIEPLLKKTDRVQLQAIEELLVELLHFHESRRSHPPLAPNPWDKVHSSVFDKLHEVRRQRLLLFAQTAIDDTDWAQALHLAETWLPLDTSLRDAVRTLWVRYGTAKLKEENCSKVRAILNRLDEHFVQSSEAEPLRVAVRARAQMFANEAKNLPTAQAISKLEEALALWPRAPGWRDELAKLTKTYRVLYVAVQQLPENMSPATAWTNAEHQALDLLFRRLVQVRFDDAGGQAYVSDLLTELPRTEGIKQQLQIRRDAFWSSGDRLTSADVRHSGQLLETTALWRDLLEMPRFEGRPFMLTVNLKQGIIDPVAPLRFYVLPQKYRAKLLSRGDDPDFARQPLGSGPFQFVGRKPEGKRTVAVFQANPCFDRQGKYGNVREVRMMAWKDIHPDMPLPHLVLDMPPNSMSSLKKMGYADIRSAPSRRVYFLALNHRVPSLANQDLRRALAHAIGRDQILEDSFRGPAGAGQWQRALNGPFPVHSWAFCPPPRVPEDLYQPELAKSFAKKAGQQLGPLRLSLKFPADSPEVADACATIAGQVSKLFAQVEVNLGVDLKPLSSQQMRAALHQHDYELAYHHWDFPDDNFWLWPLFDLHADALRPGGSNFLGYDNDAKLQSLLRSALSHRQFTAVRENQQSIHAHLYERMPLIPLWQLPEYIAVHPSLSTPTLDPRQIFLNILDWKVNP